MPNLFVMHEKKKLILDLDGVLIITPPWKKDVMHKDGYSDFDANCINNLNQLLKVVDFEIWLSSTRRTHKTLEEFNSIFENRGVSTKIKGFLPNYSDCKSRKEEIEQFLLANKIADFIIIDDDKSLNGLQKEYKSKLIHTELLQGFTSEKLEEALAIFNS